ncbi:MAG: DUF3592 domain-containing protein [Clostridia bacterium]|nr:DUF3592 domain-containing protein [Clostridia bacterium]
MSPFAIVVLAFVAAAAVFVAWRTMNIKKNGIETQATVTRIEEDVQADSDGASVSYNYYVRYTTADGQQQEALITNPGFKKLERGEQITIKYLPQKPNAAVWIKK